MSNPISSATEEKTSAGKFNTETIIPEKFELTDEFKDAYNLMNETDKNLFITGKAGCGKSTLLRCFNRMNDLITSFEAKGTVLFENVNIYDPKVDST